MDNNEKQYIHTLFETGNFMELYRVQKETINEMLSIDTLQDFEDFIGEIEERQGFIDEDVFWLHYAAVHGESLLIGGYEEDVTEKITDFLMERLPDDVFYSIRKYLQNVYVDIDDEDNLEEKIGLCNQCLTDTDYSLRLDYDDTYYAGVYFLSLERV